MKFSTWTLPSQRTPSDYCFIRLLYRIIQWMSNDGSMSLNNRKWTTKINIVIQKSVNDRIIRRILLFNTYRSAFVPCLKRFRFHHGPFENTWEIVSLKLNIHSGQGKVWHRSLSSYWSTVDPYWLEKWPFVMFNLFVIV